MKTLTLVTTPIGNAEDITLRAIEKLKSARVIFAEDTRETKKLLELLNIDIGAMRIFSFNDHDQEKIPFMISSLNVDEFILVSDAGSPVISDPAFPLVRYILESGGRVETCPGVSAVTTALELSGLSPLPFSFHGFLPRKKGEIISKLENLKSFGGVHLFFEGPSRVLETLEIFSEVAPDAKVSVAREMTKKFESIYRFKARDYKSQDIVIKGEFVLAIEFEKSSKSNASSDAKDLAQKYVQKKSTKTLAKLLASILDISVDEAYAQLSTEKS